MSMNHYVIYSTTGNINGGKRVQWAPETYHYTPNVGSVIKKNLSGGNSESIGFKKKGWTMTLQFTADGDGTYASKADVDGWFGGTTVASHAGKFQDIDGTVYDVRIASQPDFTPAETTEYLGSKSVWRCPITWVEQ